MCVCVFVYKLPICADNHATFMDLVLSGVVGLQPAPNGSLTVTPLVPAATLPWLIQPS